MSQQTIRILLALGAGALGAACSGAGDSGPGSDNPTDAATGTRGDSGPRGGGALDDGDPLGTDSGASSSPPSSDGGARRGDAGRSDAAAPGATGDAGPSSGCGAPAPAAGDGTIDVGGTSRAYILALPKNYDAHKPYKLVFAWHGQGGTAAQVASIGYYGLQSQAADGTIFVAGQGLTTTNQVGTGAGWANTNGQDVAFVKALYARLQSTVCFDSSRVFSVGMSYGGIMSDTLGCQMGDVFRAIAPMSGMGPGYGGRSPACVGAVAVWMSNGNNDTTVPTAQEEASKDFWVKENHCQTTSKAVDPSPCVAFDGCDPASPVTWCEFAGGHTIPSFASKAIWAFFSQF